MAIHRAPRPAHSFTQIRNDVLRDDRLSFRSRGLLAYILSNTDGWATDSVSLASDRPGEGRDGIRTALTELEDAGYLVREKRQDSRGRWATHQVIYDTPREDAQPALFSQVRPTTAQPAPGEPTPDGPTPDNPALKKNTIHRTDLPTEGGGATAPPPAHIIATAVYDQTQGMVNFMGIRQIAARAMKVKGATPDRVTQIIVRLYQDDKPVTLQTVGQALSRGDFRQTNVDHWANGAEF